MAFSIIQKRKKQGLIRDTVKKILNQPALEDLSVTELALVANSVLTDNLKSKIEKEVAKARIDVDRLKADWLGSFDSYSTRRSFRLHLDYFLTWLGETSVLEVNHRDADEYLRYLKNVKIKGRSKRDKKLSISSIRQRMAAPSSFFSKLVRWQFIEANPFWGCSLPKIHPQTKKVSAVPTEWQLNQLEKYCLKVLKAPIKGRGIQRKIKGWQIALAALRTLRETGLRIGALSSLDIDKKRFYTADTKGVKAEGRISKELLKSFSEMNLDRRKPFRNYTGFPMWFHNVKKDFKFTFSIHGIRHLFAIREYKANKDIVRLQRLLGHKSLSATLTYLATLKNI